MFRNLQFITAIVSTSPSKQTYLLAGNHSAFIIPRRKKSRQSLFSHNWRLLLDIIYSLQELFYRLVNTLGIQTVLLYQSSSGTRLAEDILHTDLLHLYRVMCTQAVADCTSQSANDGMLFHGDYLAGLLRAVKDDLLIERLNGTDVYNLCADAFLFQHLRCTQSGIYADTGGYDGDIFTFTDYCSLTDLE